MRSIKKQWLKWLTFLPSRNASVQPRTQGILLPRGGGHPRGSKMPWVRGWPPSSPNAHGRKRRFNKSSAKDLVLDFDRFSA